VDDEVLLSNLALEHDLHVAVGSSDLNELSSEAWPRILGGQLRPSAMAQATLLFPFIGTDDHIEMRVRTEFDVIVS